MAPKPKIVVSGLLVVALQWALAIFAWGGVRPFFAHRAFVALAAVVVCMMLVAPFTGGNFSAGNKEDRSNRWVIAALFVLAVLNAFLSPLTDRLGFLTVDRDAARWVGVALFACGGALRLWAVFVLGASAAWSPYRPTTNSILAESTDGFGTPHILAWRSICWAGRLLFVRLWAW